MEPFLFLQDAQYNTLSFGGVLQGLCALINPNIWLFGTSMYSTLDITYILASLSSRDSNLYIVQHMGCLLLVAASYCICVYILQVYGCAFSCYWCLLGSLMLICKPSWPRVFNVNYITCYWYYHWLFCDLLFLVWGSVVSFRSHKASWGHTHDPLLGVSWDSGNYWVVTYKHWYIFFLTLVTF